MPTGSQNLNFAIKAVNEASAAMKAAQQDLDNIGKSADGANTRMANFEENAVNSSKRIALGLAAVGVAAAAAVTLSVKHFADFGSEIHDMSQRTGLAAQTLSELKYAADQSGTSIEQLEVGIKRMQVAITEANTGSDAAKEKFQAIGIALDELKGKTPDEQFNRITAAIANIQDPTARAAEAVAIFGRAGTSLLPILAEGSDGLERLRKQARDLGVTMTDEAAAKADRLGDAMHELRTAVSGLTLQVGAALAPAISVVAEAISTLLLPAMERAINIVRQLTRWFLEHKEVLIAVAAAIATLLVPAFVSWAVAAASAALSTLAAAAPLVALAAAVGLVTAAIVWLGRNWDTVWEALPGPVQGALNAVKGFAEGFVNVLKTALNWLIDQLNKIQFTIPSWVPGVGGKEFGINIPHVEVMFGAIGDLVGKGVSTVKGALDKLGDGLHLTTPAVKAFGDATDDVTDSAGKASKTLKDLADDLTAAQIEAKDYFEAVHRLEMDQLHERIQAYLDHGQEAADILGKQQAQQLADAEALAVRLHDTFGVTLADALGIAMDRLQKQSEGLKAAMDRASQSAYDLTVKLWQQAGGGLSTAAALDLQRVARQAAGAASAQDIINAAFGGVAAAQGVQVGQFAEGGWVPGPVGMPQLAIVHGGEYVVPAGGGGTTVQVVVNAAPGANLWQAGKEIVDAINYYTRNGGTALS